MGQPTRSPEDLMNTAEQVLPAVVDLRRQIHADPEIGLNLPRTQEKILAQLDGLGLELSVGSELSSVVADLPGPDGSPVLLLRGDMDALPLQEDTDLGFSSTVDGAMHACGHDAHVAMLVGAAKVLAERRDELDCSVRFFFQPGEEGYGGARLALAEGLLVGPKVDAGFALHISPNLGSGVLSSRSGPIMGSADEVTITITGRGGHASTPHLCHDPIPVAAETILALQSMVTRRLDAFDPAVLTIANIHGGTTSNVIPESVLLGGTLRTVSEATRSRAYEAICSTVELIAAAHGCTALVEVDRGYPVTVNDEKFNRWAMGVLGELVGSENIKELRTPIMGSEDWSYVLQKVPGIMAFLGVCPADYSPGSAAPCHSNRMVLDEHAMAVGVAAHVAVALGFNREVAQLMGQE